MQRIISKDVQHNMETIHEIELDEIPRQDGENKSTLVVSQQKGLQKGNNQLCHCYTLHRGFFRL
jgi:hypothetical protein